MHGSILVNQNDRQVAYNMLHISVTIPIIPGIVAHHMM